MQWRFYDTDRRNEENFEEHLIDKQKTIVFFNKVNNFKLNIMPATSKFKIPFKDNSRPPAIASSLKDNKDIERRTAFTEELSIDCRPSYQIVQVERHHYSMIKYTKMVTNVTFK